MDENEHILFHPLDEPQTAKGPIHRHFQKHYKKHLFGLGILLGIGIFKIVSILGTSFGINTTTDTLTASYELSPTEQYIQIVDQIDVLANQKDKFFHQEGKIYSLTGETLFHKSDTTFHILDSAYHSASGVEEKFKRGKKLNDFLKIQDALFHSTQDINTDRETSFYQLNDALKQLERSIQNE